MFSVSRIYSDNNATFYNYNTGAPLARTRFWTCVAIASVLCAAIFTDPGDNFLGAIITAQSILAGFGFNVLFFLLSTSNTTPRPENDTLEGGLRRSRLTKLSKEIFSNISYFNLVSISSVFIALLILMPGLSSNVLQHASAIALKLLPKYQAILETSCLYIKFVLRFCLIAMLYVLVIESIYTFIRTISRITFFFRRKLELLHHLEDSSLD